MEYRGRTPEEVTLLNVGAIAGGLVGARDAGGGTRHGGGWRCFVLCAVLVAALCVTAKADWQQLGGSLNQDAGRDAQEVSIAIHGGEPYVTWSEEDSSGVAQIYVKRYTGDGWIQLGGSLNVDLEKDATEPDIAFGNGSAYVAWVERGVSHVTQLYVKRYSGGAWVQLGGALNVDTGQHAFEPSITASDTQLYVAWTENPAAGADQIYVKVYAGGTWVQLGDSLNVDSNRQIYNPDIALHEGEPHVAWREVLTTTNSHIYVKRYTGGAWTQLGGVLNVDSTQDVGFPSIASDGMSPYVAWQEHTADGRVIYVKRYTTGAWAAVGGSPTIDPDESSSSPALVIDGLTPIIAWRETADVGEHPTRLYVKELSAGLWQLVGTNPLNVDPSLSVSFPAIASAGGVPVVAWRETNPLPMGNVYVKRHGSAVGNRSPTVDRPIPDQSATVGIPFAYQFPADTFSDPDGDDLSYAATLSDGSLLPGWLSFTGGTRTFSGVPIGVVTLSIKVTAEDGRGADVSDAFGFVISQGATRGDVDLDGSITILDVRLLFRHVCGILALSSEQAGQADVDGDGDVDMDDATMLAEYVLGIRASLP